MGDFLILARRTVAFVSRLTLWPAAARAAIATIRVIGCYNKHAVFTVQILPVYHFKIPTTNGQPDLYQEDACYRCFFAIQTAQSSAVCVCSLQKGVNTTTIAFPVGYYFATYSYNARSWIFTDDEAWRPASFTSPSQDPGQGEGRLHCLTS
jgi:hypothetical protein